MEVKIKNNNEMIDATIEMVDGIMVVSPKKFEPKDGDVVVCDDGGIQIFICKKSLGDSIYSYCMYDIEDNELTFYENISYTINRPATEEEKKLLFDKLAEEGWEWKEDTKKLIKLKWTPKEGEQFWYPFNCLRATFSPISSYFNIGRDKDLLDRNWCFKTEQECQEFCKRLNEAINSVKP